MNQSQAGADVETRLRTMRILWAVFFNTIFLFVIIAYFASQPEPGDAEVADGGGSPATYLFFAVALTSAALSFVMKKRFFDRGEREKRPEQVQTGFVLALVLCEVGALLGVVAVIAFRDPLGYLLIALTALGYLLHFPRREPLLAASQGPAIG
jgi:hypothetical protein